MTKTEFFNLIEKFEKAECTPVEKSLLKRFCEEVQIKNTLEDWELSKKEEVKIRLLQRILRTIANNEVDNVKSPKRRFKIWRIAAVFIMLIGGGVLLQKIVSEKPTTSGLEEQITLQLPDGSIQVINEVNHSSITSTTGNVIGSIKNKSLVYDLSIGDGPVEFHTLKVPYGKKFQIKLNDGSLVFMNAGSSLTYPSRFLPNQTRKVKIKGEAFFEVSKDSLRPFIVNADRLNISVLGTRFNVQSYEEDVVTEVVLTEGAVALYSGNENATQNSTLLSPGEMGVLEKESNVISKTSVIPGIYTSWMSGQLVFREMPFKNIIKKLERHYNLVIINENEELANEKFNASFDSISINKVFESLREYHGIEFKRVNDTIIIQ
tara:strand:- start:9003 stop:10133 length:1131 start_codon:yes stop_codon:yes gene_type:complete